MGFRGTFGGKDRAEFLQTISVTAGRRVGRQAQEPTDRLEGLLVPNLEHNDLSLFGGQTCQGTHGGPFGGSFIRIPFEPALGFKLPGQTAQKGTAMVEGAVSDGPEEVIFRLSRPVRQLDQSSKHLVQNVFSLSMAQAKGAAIQ